VQEEEEEEEEDRTRLCCCGIVLVIPVKNPSPRIRVVRNTVVVSIFGSAIVRVVLMVMVVDEEVVVIW